MAVSRRDKQEYACKIISKAKLVHEEDREDMRREIQILRHLSGNRVRTSKGPLLPHAPSAPVAHPWKALVPCGAPPCRTAALTTRLLHS